jgi:hypothetical protein
MGVISQKAVSGEVCRSQGRSASRQPYSQVKVDGIQSCSKRDTLARRTDGSAVRLAWPICGDLGVPATWGFVCWQHG